MASGTSALLLWAILGPAGALLPPQRPVESKRLSPPAVKAAVAPAAKAAQPRKLTVYVDGGIATSGSRPRHPASDFYWKEAKIHNFGNTGLFGRLHALVAPLATLIIDSTSYGGRHVRREVHSQLKGAGSVLDLCCGVGMSTAPDAVGVDASEEMIDAARFYHPGTTFRVGNAETYGEFITSERAQRLKSPMPRAAGATWRDGDGRHGPAPAPVGLTSCSARPVHALAHPRFRRLLLVRRGDNHVRNARDAAGGAADRPAQRGAGGPKIRASRRH
eukprot:scaffold29666_cov106-Isochrysis_galbana.AAC.3